MESLTADSEVRYTLFPLQNPDIYEWYKKHQALYWTVEEVDLSQDLAVWKTMTPNERLFIENILAFFAASDGIVVSNLLENFTREVKVLEAQMFYTYQAMMENIHSEMYSRMIEALVTDIYRKNTLFRAMHEVPAIKRKAEWALKWISSDQRFAVRLVAFAIVEGVQFQPAFCAIDWLEHNKILLRGLIQSNRLIARDESLHSTFAVYLYKTRIVNKLSEQEFRQMLEEAVSIEIEFITETVPCALIGMNSGDMITYTHFIANRLAAQLGFEKPYKNAYMPFPFMEMRNFDDMTNFFEGRNANYKRAVVTDFSKIDREAPEISFDGDLDF